MATKREELAMLVLDQGCLGRAADDEPLFILRAQDRAMVPTIRSWIEHALAAGTPAESPKLLEAAAYLRRVEIWQATHSCRAPD